MQKYVAILAQNISFFIGIWEFERIFSDGGFDIVIGNPPYLDSDS